MRLSTHRDAQTHTDPGRFWVEFRFCALAFAVLNKDSYCADLITGRGAIAFELDILHACSTLLLRVEADAAEKGEGCESIRVGTHALVEDVTLQALLFGVMLGRALVWLAVPAFPSCTRRHLLI